MATTTTTFRTPSGMPNPDYINTIIPAQRNIICLIAKNSSVVTTPYLFTRNAADLDVAFKDPTGLSTPSILNLSVSDGKVRFETASVEKVKVYSVTGQCVKSMDSVAGQNSITLTGGIYFIKIGASVSKVFVK